MEFIEKTRILFFRPATFYKKVKNEKKYMPILIYFVLYYLILQILNLLLEFKYSEGIFGSRGQMSAVFHSAILIFFLIFIVAIAFAGPFIGAGITHLGIMVFGGAGKFFDTFKASTYATVLWSIYGIPLLTIGYLNPYNLDKQILANFFNIYTILGLVIGIVSIIHIFYTQCTGLSQYHRISKIRALASILLIPIILFILAIIGAVFFLSIIG